MTASERLAALGLELPEVASPVGTYVPAKRHGDLVSHPASCRSRTAPCLLRAASGSERGT